MIRMDPSPQSAIFFTQQTVGLGARKTSMIFLAEALARQGYAVSVVTVQLSWLTRFNSRARIEAIPSDRRNRWYDAAGLRGFVWVPPVHPVRTGVGMIDRLTSPMVRAYGWFMPGALRSTVRAADLIVIESCAAVALYRSLRRLAPQASFIYSMSDRLDAVGMHPALSGILAEDAPHYDLVRVPAAALLGDLPNARTAHIPHGLDKCAFEGDIPSPYTSSRPAAVLAGDMMLDQALLCRLATHRPDVDFHCFGRMGVGPEHRRPNVIVHGEVSFANLVPFIVHADVGLALYLPKAGLEYLAQSSLKTLQYAYCGLPIMAPHYVADGLPRAFGYAPDDLDGAAQALDAALASPGGEADLAVRDGIRDWDAAASSMLELAGIGHAKAGLEALACAG